MCRANLRRQREAFTLIELIVVISLILLLAGIAARFLPTASTSEREARVGAQVQGWFNTAKQKALRDQAPRGVRLWNKNGDLRVTECEFIELPDPYTGDPVFTDPTDPSLQTIIFQPIGAAAGAPAICNGYPATPSLWLVQPGDYICVNSGQMRQMTSLQVNPKNASQVVATLNSPMPYAIYSLSPNTPTPGTNNYYILRAPRPVGDETLQLPLDDPTPTTLRGIVIDLNTNIDTSFDNPAYNPAKIPWNYIPGLTTATPYLDVLFMPTGQAMVFVATVNGVTNTISSSPVALTLGKLHLWVRSVDVPRPGDPPGALIYFTGDPTLVSINLANGYVGAFSPDPQMPQNNPYFYAMQ